MEAQEIIKKFISFGFQLNSESLDFLLHNQEKIDATLENLNKLSEKPTTITAQTINTLFSEKQSDVKIIEDFISTKKTLSISDIAEVFQNQYNTIKKFLVDRPELPNIVSINKISDKPSEFSIIARVSEIDGNRMTLEDPTMQMAAKTSAEAEQERKLIIEGEIAGFVCNNTDGELHIKKIVWPDIQFRREATRSKEKYLVIFSNASADRIPKDFPKGTKIFFVDNILRLEDDIDKILPNPCIIEIGGIKIFLSNRAVLKEYKDILGDTGAKIILNLVRKRLIPIANTFPERFALDMMPDIFVVGSFGSSDAVTYKGTTFLCLSDAGEEKMMWQIDLQTRENVKIDLE